MIIILEFIQFLTVEILIYKELVYSFIDYFCYKWDTVTLYVNPGTVSNCFPHLQMSFISMQHNAIT